MTREKKAAFDLEAALQQLQQLVEKMEQGQLPLEESLKRFEEGLVLVKQCQAVLQQAEQRVQVLMGESLKDYEAAAE